MVTLEGDGVLASEEESPLSLASDEVPELMRRLHPRIVSVLGLYDAIADAERIEPAGEQETNRWADAYNKLSGSLADVSATARQEKVCANVALKLSSAAQTA